MIDFSVHMPTVGPTGYDYPQKMQNLLDALQIIGNMFDASGNYSGGSVSASTFLATDLATFNAAGIFSGSGSAASGNWTEVGYASGTGKCYVQAYDRTNTAYLPLRLIGSEITIEPSGSAVGTFSSTGFAVGSIGTVLQVSGGMTNTLWRIREKSSADMVGLSTNENDAGNQDDATKSSWKTEMGYGGGNDLWRVARRPAAAAWTTLLEVGSTGTLSATAGAALGSAIFVTHSSTTGWDSLIVYGANADGSNAADTAVRVLRNATTGRSVSAGGTINASGADYSEYETKADGCGAVIKGQIIGFDADGKVTDKWADAIRFGVKSTNPNLVGGDKWGTADKVGARPSKPIYEGPAYEGPDKPKELAQIRAAPEPLVVKVPAEPSAPSELVRGKMTDLEWSRAVNAYVMQEMEYRVALNVRAAAVAAQAAAAQAYEAALAAWTAEKREHDAAVAQYAADLAAWQAAQDTHAAAVQAAEAAHVAAVAQYEADLDAFEVTLEAARVKVDRIAYCGKCPVNVTGASVGDYIVPIQAGEGITGTAVTAAAITFDQYRVAVGQVQRILDDGRAEIVVKPI